MEKEIVQSELQEMEGVYNLKLLLKGQLIFEMPVSHSTDPDFDS